MMITGCVRVMSITVSLSQDRRCKSLRRRDTATHESILSKGREHTIFFIVVFEECTNVTGFCELGTRKRNVARGPHGSFLPRSHRSAPIRYRGL